MTEITELEKVETVEIAKSQLETLLQQNKELKTMTFATTELVLFAVDLIGGKIPKGIGEVSGLVGKLIKIYSNGIDETKMQKLSVITKTLTDFAPKYLTEKQFDEIMKTGLLQLIEKK